MIREIILKIKGSKSEIDVIDAMSDICKAKNFNTYDFPPPTMV